MAGLYGFESRPSRVFVTGVVHIQCPKLFKCLECTVLSMIQCTTKQLEGFILLRYYYDCAEGDVRQYAFIYINQYLHRYSLSDKIFKTCGTRVLIEIPVTVLTKTVPLLG